MKKLISILMIAMLVCTMVGCRAQKIYEDTRDGYSIREENISETEMLVFDTKTRIVYICNRTNGGHEVYTLYLSENGLPYRYIDGKLTEVDYSDIN